jgi:hypothetical protein
MMDELANSLGRRRTAITGVGGGGGGGRQRRDAADVGVEEGSSKIQGLGEYMKSKSKDRGQESGSGSDSDWD